MGQKENIRIQKELKKFKAGVSRDFPVQKMYVFGSRARGTAGKFGDIDLLIVSPKFRDLDFIRRGARMYDHWEIDHPVDFLCYSPEEFKRMKNRATIVREAVLHGIEI
jgi:predicted nucleotidyltransferase